MIAKIGRGANNIEIIPYKKLKIDKINGNFFANTFMNIFLLYINNSQIFFEIS